MGVRLTSASGTEVEMKSMRPSSGKHAPGTLVASSSHSSGDEDEDDALVMQLLERQNPGLLKVRTLKWLWCISAILCIFYPVHLAWETIDETFQTHAVMP
jgi:hypothetical protein